MPFFGTISSGSVIGIAVDFTSSLIWFRVGTTGNWNTVGTANPATGTGGLAMGLAGTALYAYEFVGGTATDLTTANFGATALAGVVPSGFTAGFGTPGTSGAVSFAQGDVIRLRAPATPDATLADFFSTLVGYET